MPEETHLKKLIIEHRRRLQKLKEQAARFGINTPPEILTEIEEIEAELKRLQAELETEQTQLQQTLANLSGLNLPGAAEFQQQIKARLTAIEQQLKSIRPASSVFDQRQQQVSHQINVAGNYYAAGEPEPKTLDQETALARYLGYVIDANRRLQLQGIRSGGELVSIDLEDIYVTLTATERRSVAAEEAWLAETSRLAPGEGGRLARLGGTQSRETTVQVTVKVQEALAAHSRLVVVGDPGSGKTTLLRYLALTYARDLTGETGLVKERLTLSESRLPILLHLREFASYLENKQPDPSTDGPKLLLDYLRIYFAHQEIALPERFFAERLQENEGVVLLDGVDEVANVATRHRIASIIERFTLAYPENRYVVTSRVVGYTGPARLGEEYVVTKVRDFSQADIEHFVSYWNSAVEVALAGEDTSTVRLAASRNTEALLLAIKQNERVRELAVNPLLLTVIALVQRYRAKLPERRTELYEEAIEVLLGNWDEAKGMQSKTMLAGLELDAGDKRSLLEPVALGMMEKQARGIEQAELRRQLSRPFASLVGNGHQVRKLVDAFLQLINERSGLLTERGQGLYTFSHLTFQEHLAARAIADRADYIAYTLARLENSWWRETILLEAGYLSTQGKRRATALIKAMMEYEREPEPYHNLVLAAECLHDLGAARVEGDLGLDIQRRLRREFERPLKAKSENLTEAIRRRAAAGEALARVESGRSGTQPAFWSLPYGEPVWVTVPAGEFWMGSERGAKYERPPHCLHLETFRIARVPITNSQYQFFVEAGGHKPPSFWEGNRPPRGQESHPVVRVTWHEALAYCRWLSQVTGKSITLPSEAQWEKAARGGFPPAGDQRKDKAMAPEYPWGHSWDETKCNSSELGLDGTTPVGIFPEGASPYGCLDMAGNVWEWTRSLWGKDWSKPAFKYPYDPTDGRENVAAGDEIRRVLRGGSWLSTQDNARCASRFRIDPDLRFDYYGFRVVVSPISPPSARGRVSAST